MKRFTRWREGRRIVEADYRVPQMTTAGEAMLRHMHFVATCGALDLTVARSKDPVITIRGRARNVAAFQRRMAVTA